jgi:predicted thioesterase
MKFPGITRGISKTINHTVSHRDTAGNFLPDDVEPLLSSPGLISLVVDTSIALIDPLLPDGFMSVGKSSQVTHEHPSVLGAHVTLTLSVQEFDGYHITLRFVASDESGVVGTGTHTRSIVNKRWLQLRIAHRAGA